MSAQVFADVKAERFDEANCSTGGWTSSLHSFSSTTVQATPFEPSPSYVTSQAPMTGGFLQPTMARSTTMLAAKERERDAMFMGVCTDRREHFSRAHEKPEARSGLETGPSPGTAETTPIELPRETRVGAVS
jgi:hypothetical protein